MQHFNNKKSLLTITTLILYACTSTNICAHAIHDAHDAKHEELSNILQNDSHNDSDTQEMDTHANNMSRHDATEANVDESDHDDDYTDDALGKRLHDDYQEKKAHFYQQKLNKTKEKLAKKEKKIKLIKEKAHQCAQSCSLAESEKNELDGTYQLLDTMYQSLQKEHQELLEESEDNQEQKSHDTQKIHALMDALDKQLKAQKILQEQMKHQEEFSKKMTTKYTEKIETLSHQNTQLKKQLKSCETTIKAQHNSLNKQKYTIKKLEKKLEKMHARMK